MRMFRIVIIIVFQSIFCKFYHNLEKKKKSTHGRDGWIGLVSICWNSSLSVSFTERDFIYTHHILFVLYNKLERETWKLKRFFQLILEAKYTSNRKKNIQNMCLLSSRACDERVERLVFFPSSLIELFMSHNTPIRWRM